MRYDIYIGELIRAALAEDIGPCDITTYALLDPDTVGKADVIAKEALVLSGSRAFEHVFLLLDPRTQVVRHFKNGERAEKNERLFSIRGNLRAILSGERVALNFLQRLSGIATFTRRFIEKVKDTGVAILDTRKTTPLWRVLEKEAVLHGGGMNHRFGLFDGILIKDNHIAAVGGIASAVERARAAAHHLIKVEVEVESMEQVEEAIEAGADALLLDNMTSEEIKKVVEAAGGRVLLEASGGITLENVLEYARTGVNSISLGALTHSAPAVDISLKVNMP